MDESPDLPTSPTACPMCGASLLEGNTISETNRYAGLSSARGALLVVSVAFVVGALTTITNQFAFVWLKFDSETDWLHQEITANDLWILFRILVLTAYRLTMAWAVWQYAGFLKNLQAPGPHAPLAAAAFRVACLVVVAIVAMIIGDLLYKFAP